MSAGSRVRVGGPYFEDLEVGQVFEASPALTLTDGLAAVHQALVGDRLRLPLDRELSRRVLGREAALAHPALVWDVSIGQSTLATHRVIANLFYRGFVLRRLPVIGDTLGTRTEVVALRQNRPRPDRPATGLAVLRITTTDQERRPVLDFWRCAMLPLREPDGNTGRADDLDAIPAELDAGHLLDAVEGWDLDAFRAAVAGPRAEDLEPGTVWEVEGGDVVDAAPALARLSLNVAMAHHDRTVNASGRRLVYGGHTIALAASQLSRALPSLVTIVAWHGCDHTAPVFEGDTLFSTVTVEAVDGGLVHLRVQVKAARDDGGTADVLDWRPVAVLP